jgi:hypothetical protein
MAGRDDESGEAERPWWRWRRKEQPGGAMVADVRTARGDEDERAHGGHGPSVGQVSTGSGGTIVPMLIGVLLLLAILGFQLGAFRWIADNFGTAPSNDPKTAAMTEAEVAVAQGLNTASSIVFDSVRGVSAHEACGVVENRGHDGGISRKRFIFQAGLVRLDDGSDDFARAWDKNCQPVGTVSSDPAAGAPHRARHRHSAQ